MVGKFGIWKSEKPIMEPIKDTLLKCIIISLSPLHELSTYHLESTHLLRALNIDTNFGKAGHSFVLLFLFVRWGK